MMKGVVCKFKVVLIILILLPAVMYARHTSKLLPNHGHNHQQRSSKKDPLTVKPNLNRVVRRPFVHKRSDPMRVAGSRLPDCTHACGSCTPCRLVMVSFVCSSIEEAETCPMAYKCMCNNKSYPVP
ncbi:hypothetical protein RD792_006231 [Penstemon davidsonii]|uniref:Epidermal patterning factor-like protein n=1 Tax=Penstemon davidsonii TaxID=160366 RepID=A0ABR0DCD6_9LAMI|nr:hypothetical protein RD792_006231 [Penstemon davidsonii]